ncbi:hypothetical protein C8R42DRAFT_715290 [Lentinula raphanica]|nr:hypothetical protein C8R42DRAFT_715290 [Lentinula raphanica]
MSQHDHLLKRLCGSSGSTLERARELLHTVTVKTAPGTGFQLKDPAGRPAACALIASEQLKNTVVDPTSAQGSSCLNPAAFRNCLAQVRAALAHDVSHMHKPDAHAPPERRDTRSGLSGTSQVSYDSLVAKHALSRDYADRVARWCQRAEFTYLNLGKGNNIARGSPKIKLGIFFWVCKVLEPARFDLKSFIEDENGMGMVHTDSVGGISKIMDAHAVEFRAMIVAESQQPKGVVPTRSSTRLSPAKRAMMREAPTKDAPKKRKLEEDLTAESSAGKGYEVSNQVSDIPEGISSSPVSPQKSPIKPVRRDLPTRESPRKRRARFIMQEEEEDDDSDADMVPPDTPSKPRLRANPNDRTPLIPHSRPRGPSTSPLRPSGHSDIAGETQPKGSTSTHHWEDMFADDPPDHADLPVRRRFRPVFLDRKQWDAPDPLLAKIQKRMDRVIIR